MVSTNEILKKYFGYDSFREGQESLVKSILNGQDTFGIMPTGAGKSICYQVPAMMMEGITLVISPLISLMKDQVYSLNQAGIHAAYINSSLTARQYEMAMTCARNGQYKIIYVAPERLETESFMDFAYHTDISMITVDEAHCISQWGQDFRPSYLKIIQFIKNLPRRPIISAFTATATKEVREDIVCTLGLINPNQVVTGFDRPNLYFEVMHVSHNKDDVLCSLLDKHQNESGIIYCATRKSVDSLYDKLEKKGLPVARYHAGLADGERRSNQEAFIYDEKPLMIATNAFGMGIDKSNVRFVIHYNMPKNVESYYQEAGRAGRDGEPAECILMYSPQDIMIAQYMIENGGDIEVLTWEEREIIKERDLNRLKQMTYYAVTKNCLREYMLRYFGETSDGYCGNCGNCLNEYEEVDVTQTCKDILNCVSEVRQRYGINVIVGTLRGNRQAKLLAYGVDRLKSYGKCRELSEQKLKQIMNHLLVEEYLFITADKYMLLKLGKRAQLFKEPEHQVIMKCTKEELLDKPEVKKKGKARTSDILTTKGLDLFDQLRALRGEFARKEGMPPYIIFSDKSLVDMCIKIPFTKAEMMMVSGVGENKYEKYGLKFQEVIKTFMDGEKEKLYFEGSLTESDAKESKEHKEKDEAGTKTKSSTKTKKSEFFLTEDMEQNMMFSEGITLSEFVGDINDMRDESVMKRLTVKRVTELLLEQGYLEEFKEKNRRFTSERPTQIGIELGISLERRTGEKTGNEYDIPIYSAKALKDIFGMLKMNLK